MNEQKVVVNSVIIANKKVFMVRRADDAKFLPGHWEFPGGKVNYAEIPEDALRREVKEECNINIEIINPLIVDQFYMDRNISDKQFIDIFYLCKTFDYENVVINPEHTEYRWVELNDVNKLKVSKYLKSVWKKIEKHPLLPKF
jgi:8-oxo-dGTP diphosphatase